MKRINITDEDGQLIGWFNRDRAEQFDEDTDWDGSNHISVNTNSDLYHEILYRTAQGRWVLGSWSNYVNVHDAYHFVPPVEAQQWLLKNQHDEAVREYFGKIAEEEGPDLGGRPPIGPVINTRLSEDLLAAVDKEARARDESRAETIRRLLHESFQFTPEELTKQIASRGSRSPVMIRDLGRYYYLLERAKKQLQFSEQEWLALEAATMSTRFKEPWMVRTVFHCIEDARDKIKEFADVPALLEKLATFDEMRLAAMVDELELRRIRESGLTQAEDASAW